MAESREINVSPEPPRRAAPAKAAGCFGIDSSVDLHEAERAVAAKAECPSLEEFADHYFHLGYNAAVREREGEKVTITVKH